MSEITDARGTRVDYVVAGEGPAALVLHGAYSTRDEVIPVFDPILGSLGMRGVYIDLPGMGASAGSNAAQSADDVLDAIDALIAAELDDEQFVVIGHSFGGHLARGVAARHPFRLAGLALISPVVPGFEGEPLRVVEDDGGADQLDADVREDYLGYFVVRTPATRDRFERIVRPAIGRFDAAVVERIMTDAALTPNPDDAPFGGPVVVLVARDDAFVGWRAQRAVADEYPRGTFVLVADAGHALIHERPDLVHAVIGDWLERVGFVSEG